MIEIVFFTSSAIKLAHARYLCRDYDVRITGFREKTFGANYEEPRIYDREELIESSYRDAVQRWQKSGSIGEHKLFILEDTSVIIDALSSEREVPGLDIKYWMAETDFATLNAQLRNLGNNRGCTVRSDLVLHLSPELREIVQGENYLRFTSSSHGLVVELEREIATNPLYPWLDNKTFNKWFVPDGANDPLSMLPIEEADKYDFRAPAFQEMLAFLEQSGQIVKRSSPPIQTQLDFAAPLFVICGPSCAGKTTLAEYLACSYGYYHIEASDFMYVSYYQRHGVGAGVSIGDFAEQALQVHPEIVAQQVLENIDVNQPIVAVVTGFRSPKELEWFTNYYAGHQLIVAVYIEADVEIRFKRSLNRQREIITDTRERFDKRDAQQTGMGLKELSVQLKSDKVLNESDLETFFQNFVSRYLQDWPYKHGIPENNTLNTSGLEKLILMALNEQWPNREYFTTTEIAHLINSNITPLNKQRSKNNVSRYFNQRLYPYYEIKLIEGKRKYRLSNTGRGKAQLII